jgi:hypothetical protein
MAAATVVFEASNASVSQSSVQFEQTFEPSVSRSARDLFIFFPDVKFEHTTFRLREPLELVLRVVEGGWVCESRTLSLSGFGATSAEAICSVFEDFGVLWDEIALAQDDELTDDAQRTKKILCGLVISAEEIE